MTDSFAASRMAGAAKYPESPKLAVRYAPAAGLGATDRYDDLLPGLDVHGCIEHPVLLGPGELLAIEDQDSGGANVVRFQQGYRAALGDLSHHQRMRRDGLLEGDEIGDTVKSPEHRDQW